MSCANETWSKTVIGSQPSLCLGQHSSSVATPSCCVRKTETAQEIERSIERGRHEQAANESKSKSYQHKISRRVIRDHTHTDPEYVWGDEGPVNEKRETS